MINLQCIYCTKTTHKFLSPESNLEFSLESSPGFVASPNKQHLCKQTEKPTPCMEVLGSLLLGSLEVTLTQRAMIQAIYIVINTLSSAADLCNNIMQHGITITKKSACSNCPCRVGHTNTLRQPNRKFISYSCFILKRLVDRC